MAEAGQGVEKPSGQRAEPVRAPSLSPALELANAKEREYVCGREAAERRRLVRGLILLGVVVLLVSLARAGWARAFVQGWWKQW